MGSRFRQHHHVEKPSRQRQHALVGRLAASNRQHGHPAGAGGVVMKTNYAAGVVGFRKLVRVRHGLTPCKSVFHIVRCPRLRTRRKLRRNHVGRPPGGRSEGSITNGTCVPFARMPQCSPMVQVPSYLNQDWPISRQRERCPLTAPVVLSLGENLYHGWCDNLHEGGLGATVAVPLKKNDEVTLRFILPGTAEAITVRGVVRHTTGFRHGFEFLDLSSVQCAQINAFLAQARRRASCKFPPLRERRNGYKVDKAVNLVPDLPALA